MTAGATFIGDSKMILLNQRFPSCTLCGKRIPLRTEPIVLGRESLCSRRCVEIVAQRNPELTAQASLVLAHQH